MRCAGNSNGAYVVVAPKVTIPLALKQQQVNMLPFAQLDIVGVWRMLQRHLQKFTLLPPREAYHQVRSLLAIRLCMQRTNETDLASQQRCLAGGKIPTELSRYGALNPH